MIINNNRVNVIDITQGLNMNVIYLFVDFLIL